MDTDVLEKIWDALKHPYIDVVVILIILPIWTLLAWNGVLGPAVFALIGLPYTYPAIYVLDWLLLRAAFPIALVVCVLLEEIQEAR